MKTAVGVYDDVEDARDLVQDLVDRGIPREEISLVTRDESDEAEGVAYEVEYRPEDPAEGTAEAALGGAVVGGLTGILAGLGGFALPGIGPVIAAGPIAAGLAGAGVGAVTGGLLGALVEWGIPEEEAEYYAESVRRGSTLVAVRVPQGRAEEVVGAMNDYEPVDIERRVAYWREEAGWEGYDADADPYDVEDLEDFRKKREAWRRKAEEEAQDGGLIPDFEDLDDIFRE